MKDLEKYLSDSFGVTLRLVPLDSRQAALLPLYLRGSYALSQGKLFGRDMAWASFNENNNLSPEQLHQQSQQLSKILRMPVVFLISKLETWQRKRLIERQVPFVQPFRQLFIPELMLQLSDVRYQDNSLQPANEQLSPPAQFALLYHLEKKPLENIALQQIGGLLLYSAMTATRLAKELANCGLVEITGVKEKSLLFLLHGRQLWEKALPLLSSPVREIWFTDEPVPLDTCRLAGDSALASYTMLDETKQKSWAIGKDAFHYLKAKGNFRTLHPEYGENRLEIWTYDPLVLAQDKQVDRLSLYLSINGKDDERVARALDDLLNELPW